MTAVPTADSGSYAEASGTNTALEATRALLRATNRGEASRILRQVVVDLGGAVHVGQPAASSPFPEDLSLGLGTPVFAAYDGFPDPRLRDRLPLLVEDAVFAAERCDHDQRQLIRATVDPLTRVASRGEVVRRLRKSSSGDVVCVLDLDRFKQLNDVWGHDAGDDALRAFGELLREHIRDNDFVGRLGGDEFIVIMAQSPVDVAHRRMADIGAAWVAALASGSSVSIGVAVVDERGAATAVTAADQALLRAKRLGRNRVEPAEEADYGKATGPPRTTTSR